MGGCLTRESLLGQRDYFLVYQGDLVALLEATYSLHLWSQEKSGLIGAHDSFVWKTP